MDAPVRSLPYWRLSGFYFFYFASLGALLPYWSAYLKTRGYSALEIGGIFAVIMGTKVVAPYIWAWIGDHTGQRIRIVQSASLLAAVAFAGVFWAPGYAGLVAVMILFSFFWNASLPQFEVTTLNHLGSQPARYSVIRLWGSIGFICSAVVLGAYLQDEHLQYLPQVLLALCAGIWLSSLAVPEGSRAPTHGSAISLRAVLRRPGVWTLLWVCFLVQASHGPYYAFYTIYLESHPYPRTWVGQLWALGVIAEIGMFLLMYRLLRYFDARSLMVFALAITALRWYLIAMFIDSLPVLALAQLLHAASFGIVHAVAIHLVHRYFTGNTQGRGQALYSSVSFGAGGAVGSLYSGGLWDVIGPAAVFLLGTGLCLVACWCAWRGLPKGE